ncbi:PAQR family membrane homeostasis protein TrhA [Sinisalibacter lacisalsi]|uniref:DNA-binding protein n=1 Tax=Sinisalibacter lacisalsi TaxID=1526570 RepID=A0ABQ1QN84_9RHOB|nr:hemolysin III family protein [Sinisalibacter lacisalsi]GGD32472.1 DNA-binding protein [Sinisalibacter lacisalsi]
MQHHGLDHSLAEHIADGVMHVLGLAAAIAGATALLVWAALAMPPDRLWPLVPYAVGLVATFALSAAYNLTLHRKIRAVLRRFDHAAIYLMIAGTYTPMAIIGLGGGRGLALAIAAWSLAVFGITLKLAFFHRWPRLGFVLYLAQGWIGVIAAWPLMQTLPPAALVLLLVGGLTYTLGTIFYAARWRFSTAIWHGHVLAAAATHYAAVVLIAGFS